MAKKFIDKWWVRLLVVLVVPGLFSGGSGVLFGLLLLVSLTVILIRVSKNRRSPKSVTAVEPASKTGSGRVPPPAEGTFIEYPASQNFAVSIAGESHYFEAISRAVHRRTGTHVMLAEIIREPENKFDPNAVRVAIGDRTVGYIPREDAPSFHAVLSYAKSINKRVFASCQVWVSADENSFGSVSLDIDDPNSLIPPINATDVPTSAVIWPIGNTLQVSEEAKNIENVKIIFEKLRDSIGTTIFLELFTDLTKPDKPEVHVLFNGLKVGELSPASGKKFLPAVQKASLAGRKLFVKAEATGNSLAAVIKIFAKSPELLTESEITQLLG